MTVTLSSQLRVPEFKSPARQTTESARLSSLVTGHVFEIKCGCEFKGHALAVQQDHISKPAFS